MVQCLHDLRMIIGIVHTNKRRVWQCLQWDICLEHRKQLILQRTRKESEILIPFPPQHSLPSIIDYATPARSCVCIRHKLEKLRLSMKI